MKLKQIEISTYKNLNDHKPEAKSIQNYFDAIKYGQNKDDVELYRGLIKNNPKDEKAKEIKRSTAFVTPSAYCIGGRKSEHIQTHSNVICMDVDTKVNESTINKIRLNHFTLSVHKSIGGEGVCIYYKIKSYLYLDLHYFLDLIYSYSIVFLIDNL